MSDQDDELLGELRGAAMDFDAVPPHLIDSAKAAFGFRTFDADLAELLETHELAGVRAPAAPELLSFVASGGSIEIDVDADVDVDAGGRRLIGQIVPPASVDVTLEDADGRRHETTSDGRGNFVFDLPTGPTRLITEIAGGSVVTDWFTT